jgi:hypothetical protein
MAQGTNFDGVGQFKFVIGNNGMSVTHWSNDGTSTAGSEPTAAVSIGVEKGLYSVLLGDASLANMGVLPTTVFTNTDAWLRIWFNDGVNGSQLLLPDQRLGSVPYAMRANESDPSFVGTVASGISTTQTAQWSQAYGWGNHAAVGYATGTPLYVDDDSAYATGTPLYVDDDSAYATGTPIYVEVDPVYQSSPAAGITAADTTQWTEAYGWGNHATAGYAMATAETDPIWTNARRQGYTVQGPVTHNGELHLQRAGNLQILQGPSYIELGDDARCYSSVRGGIAIGDGATARYRYSGTALGTEADGDYNGLSIGYQSDGQYTNLAIGYQASSYSGYDRVTIGYAITNRRNWTCVVRGTLYLDGGTGVLYRATRGVGSWHAKAFTIDHPLDPENKVLRHFCMEGPEVWNLYAGNVQLENGMATIELPDYYGALNLAGSEVYSLTPVGGPATLWVASEVADNRFMIAGSDDIKVSWKVKALRNDPGCLEDLRQRPVEQLKAELK